MEEKIPLIGSTSSISPFLKKLIINKYSISNLFLSNADLRLLNWRDLILISTFKLNDSEEIFMPENNCGFYCPKCGKMADTAHPMFIRYSMRRLELPIFLCSPCRTIYIDKPTIRKIISEWRNNGAMLKKIPLESLYREFLGKIENLVTSHFVPYLGYKIIRFLKNPPKSKP